MTASRESWDEFCRIGIKPAGYSNSIQFAALTDDITAMDWGERDIEGVPNVAGGRTVKKTPMSDESITFKMVPVTAKNDGTGVMQLMHPQDAEASTDPIRIFNSNNRNKHKITLLWAANLPAAAETIPDVGSDAYRIQILNAYCTKCKPAFDDKRSTVEMTFKWAPFQKNGSANKVEESSGTATQLTSCNTAVDLWGV